MGEGEQIAFSFFSNLVGIMGFFGLILLVITPLYAFKIFKKRGHMGKPMITFFFGLMFFLTWIFEGAV